MININDGGPAFPAQWEDKDNDGMNLRTYVATKVLAGFCTMSDETGGWSWYRGDAVKEAVRCADDLIAELSKGCAG